MGHSVLSWEKRQQQSSEPGRENVLQPGPQRPASISVQPFTNVPSGEATESILSLPFPSLGNVNNESYCYAVTRLQYNGI